MSMPQQRLRDPQPLSRGGEVAFVVLSGSLLLLGLAALAGLGAAGVLFGGGWIWPHGTPAIGQVLGGLLTGDPGQGMHAPAQTRVPGPVAVYGCVAVAELMLLSATGVGGVLFVRYRRPPDARGGMATRPEAEQVLGRSRLRQAHRILRPDLSRDGGRHRAGRAAAVPAESRGSR